MSINWRKKQEKRYEEPRRRLSRLFWFIFVNLNNSPINFELCSKGLNKTKKINKEYDVCLLISLAILKLVNNSADVLVPSKRESSHKCTDEELLLIWYLYFGKGHLSDGIKNAIPEERRNEIKVPDICAGFFDENREKEIRKNNLGSYLNTIPKKKIQECIQYLFTILDNVSSKESISVAKEKTAFTVFLRNFVNSMDIPIPSSNLFISKEKLDKLKYPYYLKKCYGKNGKLWEYLCIHFPKEVGTYIPGTSLKRFSEYKTPIANLIIPPQSNIGEYSEKKKIKEN